MAGTGVAAQHGILIKDAEALELAHAVGVVAWDKTGTLTQGRPQLVQVLATEADRAALLKAAAALQAGSSHPLARAVLQAANDEGLTLPLATNVRAVGGRGVAGDVEGMPLRQGSLRWMQESGVDLGPWQAELQRWQTSGHTVSGVAAVQDPPRLLGLLAFADTAKPHAAQAVRQLDALGVRSVLLTGDNAGSAEVLARAVGIATVHAEVLPADKARIVTELKASLPARRQVAMVGDGINDAPALAAADVGMAMGSGTDVAMSAAGITLMRGDPALVADALDISRRTHAKIRQNLFWAFIFNAVGIPLAAAGLLSPVVAGAAMAMSSVTVVSNALLLRRWKGSNR